MDIEKLIEQFNAEGVDRNQKTREWYGWRLRPYLADLDAQGVELADSGPAHVRGWLARLRADGRSWSTRNGTRTALRAFYGWAVARGLVAADPFEVEHIPRPRKPKRVPRRVGIDTVRAVLGAAKSDDVGPGDRDYAMMLLMLDTGLRRAEVVGLDIRNVDLQNGVVFVLKGKGDNQRVAYIGQPTIEAIKGWLKNHPYPKKPPLFVSVGPSTFGERLGARAVNHILTRWSEQAGLPEPIRPHDLRRLFATMFAERGGGMNILQGLMGHNDVQTTMGYIAITEEAKREQHAKYSPANLL